jgi:tRNA(adenine34) deaminase
MTLGAKLQETQDEEFMLAALAQATEAAAAGEVPVGAVVVVEERIVGRGQNRTRRDGVVHAHAELVALGQAERVSGDFRLEGCTLYVTAEPCLMCLGALLQARITRLVYGAQEPKFGALVSAFELLSHPALRRVEVTSGVLADQAQKLLKTFFCKLRGEA